MKDKFNNMLNKIEVTKELDERVLNNTIYKKKNNNIFRSTFKVATCIVLFIVFSTISYASIKSILINHNYSKNGNDKVTVSILNKVTISKNAKLDCKNELNVNDIEKELGIKLLKYTSFNKNSFNCEIKTSDDNLIKSVKLVNDDDYSTYVNLTFEERLSKNLINNKYLELTISFMTNYATTEEEENFKNLEMLVADKEYVDQNMSSYFIKGLNIESTIINLMPANEKFENSWPVTICFFTYNDIYYNFVGRNFSVDEMKTMLENLHF